MAKIETLKIHMIRESAKNVLKSVGILIFFVTLQALNAQCLLRIQIKNEIFFCVQR
jgi:hypothetical protein